MKHTTIKSNRNNLLESENERAVREAFAKLLSDVPHTRIYVKLAVSGGKYGSAYDVAVYTLNYRNDSLEVFLGVWSVVVPWSLTAPLRVRFFGRKDWFDLHRGIYPYRPALLPLRLAKLCPDWNPDDPFDGAANFHPVRS